MFMPMRLVRAQKLRDLEIDLAGVGLQRPIVAASPGVLPSLAALVMAAPIRARTAASGDRRGSA